LNLGVSDEAGGGIGRGVKDFGNGAFAGGLLGIGGGWRGVLLGALLGGTASAAAGMMSGGKEKSETEKQTELLGKIANNTDPSNLPGNTGDIPGARQVGALQLARFLG
jgi:hypothetical protein